MYATVEYRALRGMEAAQRVLMAGYTSMADPATPGMVTPSTRDVVAAGLFVGPRITSAGRQLTGRQGLSDWHPRWIGYRVRRSAYWCAMRPKASRRFDARSRRVSTSSSLPFVPHTKSGRKYIDFTQATDGCYPDFPDAHKRELESACKVLPKAKAAGVPFMVGSDAGFAVSPYGEWHARELDMSATTPAATRRSGLKTFRWRLASGRIDELNAFVDKCLSEYDLNGWTSSDLINPHRPAVKRSWN